jgi:hypothetical protein
LAALPPDAPREQAFAFVVAQGVGTQAGALGNVSDGELLLNRRNGSTL